MLHESGYNVHCKSFALAEKAGINLRHLIAVEDGREEATQQDIEAISRVFHVKPEDWLK